MSEINVMSAPVQASLSLEDLLSSFGVRKLSTAKDEGLLSVNIIKKRLIDGLDYNIQQFKNDSWNEKNQMMKLLVDKKKESLDECIFSLRVMGKRIFKCACHTPTPESKIEFLTSIKALLENGHLDKEITDFCEKEVMIKKERRAAVKERIRQRNAEKRALIQKGRLMEEAINRAKQEASEIMQVSEAHPVVA